MQLYLAMDPFDFRLAVQDRPFERTDFPRGAQGENWPQRAYTMTDEQMWADLLSGRIAPHDQDRVHIDWWNGAGGHWPDD